MKLFTSIALLALLLAASGCTFTSTADDFNGLPGADGKAVQTHVNQSKLSLTLFFNMAPLAGDATLQSNVADVTAGAVADGATGIRIVQSDESLLWWVAPPFSFIFTPMMSNVGADCVK